MSMQNSNNNNFGRPQEFQDQYQKMDNGQEMNVNLDLEKFKRTKFQNFEATSKQLIELAVLHKEMATEQTDNIDQFNKKYSNTTKIIQQTEKHIQEFREENKTNWGKLACYLFVIFCIFLALLSLKSLGNP